MQLKLPAATSPEEPVVSLAPYARVVVVGATSQIGKALLPRLLTQRLIVFCVGRESRASGPDIVHAFDEDRNCFDPPIATADAIISLAPLPSIERVVRMAQVLGAKRIIAFGSTGRFSKLGSSSALERDFVAQQQRAEQVFSSKSEAAGIAWTLFRPTMIYGADADQNVSFVRSLIRKFGFFPLPRGAQGLRQPVHVDDLAAACVSALGCKRSFNRAYNLGGGEVLSYPEMVRRIFLSEGKKPRILPIPVFLYYLLATTIQRFPAAAFVRREMVERMFVDLVAENRPAVDDFGYSPRGFFLNASRKPSGLGG